MNGVKRLEKNPTSGGGFADVWRGLIESKNIRVAMKALRIFGVDGETKKEIERVCFTSTEAFSSSNNFDIQECYKEAMLWRKLAHPNILPFFGICVDEFAPQMALVSPWMENGNIQTYLKQNPTANRLNLASHCLISL